MANELIDQNFESFMSTHPNSRYEDWIADLNPENKMDDMLGLGDTIIDAKFYDPDNEYLKYWNSHLGPNMAPVQVSSSSDASHRPEDGNESDGFLQLDLLSGDGENDSQASPTSTPRRTKQVDPGEDLMKFD